MDDFAVFVRNIVRPTLPPGLPLCMMAHSMGGNLGLRYLRDHPHAFCGAVMTAPLAGIRSLRRIAFPLQTAFGVLATAVAPGSYAVGGAPWRPWNQHSELRMLCGDKIRAQVAWRWAEANPVLRVGGVTWRWLREAIATCQFIAAPGFAEAIETPVHILLAGRERLVDNRAMRDVASRLPHGRVEMLERAKHEILMETDDIRAILLKAVDAMIQKTIN